MSLTRNQLLMVGGVLLFVISYFTVPRQEVASMPHWIGMGAGALLAMWALFDRQR